MGHAVGEGTSGKTSSYASTIERKIAIASNAILAVDAQTHRVTYHINTELRSSGAPCFNQNWDLVAVHERRDPTGKAGIIMTAIAPQPKVQATLKT